MGYYWDIENKSKHTLTCDSVIPKAYASFARWNGFVTLSCDQTSGKQTFYVPQVQLGTLSARKSFRGQKSAVR